MFNLMRPQIINGIEDMVTRPDLADRSLLLTLDPIPDSERRTEAQMSADFEIERPFIMGALFDCRVAGPDRASELPICRACRAWRISPCGRSLASWRCRGLRARSCAPTRKTAPRRSSRSSKRRRLLRPFAS